MTPRKTSQSDFAAIEILLLIAELILTLLAG
jgi:hypothetical protein